MNDLRVVPVVGRAGISAFIAAGQRAQSINPHWVETLHEEIRMTFDGRAPFPRENVVQPFVAFRDGEPVGRIVATIDAAHLEKFGDACGFFGFIDAIDDHAVFAGLFAEAEQFLRSRGMRLARGPFSLTINHESGLLVDGFDQPHVVRTNHSPPHYPAHIERLGYRKAMDLLAYVCRVADAEPARVDRVTQRRSGPQLDFHRLSLLNWSRDFPRVLALYNDAWSDNDWATPVSREEGRFIAALMLPACKPRWIRIASFKGEDVALAVHIPDANEALSGLRGRLFPFGFAKFLWRIHVRGTRMTRAPMTGVARKWRNTKIGALAVSSLVAKTIEDARAAGVEEIEYSWMLETNTDAINGVRTLPARHTRTFRIYERAL